MCLIALLRNWEKSNFNFNSSFSFKLITVEGLVAVINWRFSVEFAQTVYANFPPKLTVCAWSKQWVLVESGRSWSTATFSAPCSLSLSLSLNMSAPTRRSCAIRSPNELVPARGRRGWLTCSEHSFGLAATRARTYALVAATRLSDATDQWVSSRLYLSTSNSIQFNVRIEFENRMRSDWMGQVGWVEFIWHSQARGLF